MRHHIIIYLCIWYSPHILHTFVYVFLLSNDYCIWKFQFNIALTLIILQLQRCLPRDGLDEHFVIHTVIFGSLINDSCLPFLFRSLFCYMFHIWSKYGFTHTKSFSNIFLFRSFFYDMFLFWSKYVFSCIKSFSVSVGRCNPLFLLSVFADEYTPVLAHDLICINF
jgi:hypothetical protein